MFTRSDKRVVKDGVWHNNPITFQVLGICSALAVTMRFKTALVMALGLTFVVAVSSLVISFLRTWIPSRVRILIQLSIISTLVILADQFLKAFMYDVSKQLSVFVGLIITNCIVMGRAEGFAMRHPPLRSFLDGVGNGIGYGLILIFVAALRELLGSGTFFDQQVIPLSWYTKGYADCGLMVTAPGAFFLLGLIIWLQRAVTKYREPK